MGRSNNRRQQSTPRVAKGVSSPAFGSEEESGGSAEMAEEPSLTGGANARIAALDEWPAVESGREVLVEVLPIPLRPVLPPNRPKAIHSAKPPKVKLSSAAKLGLGCVALGVLALLAQSPVIVGVGERGVVTTMGKVQSVVLGEGVHFIVPLFQSVQRGSAQIVTAEYATEVLSKDRQPVQVRLTLSYRLDPREMPSLVRDIGLTSVASKLVQPALASAPEIVVGARTTEMLLDQRQEPVAAMKNVVAERLLRRGVRIEEFDATLTFPAATLAAVDAVSTGGKGKPMATKPPFAKRDTRNTPRANP